MLSLSVQCGCQKRYSVPRIHVLLVQWCHVTLLCILLLLSAPRSAQALQAGAAGGDGDRVTGDVIVDGGAGTVEAVPWFRGFTSDWWRHNEKSAHSDNGRKWGAAGLLTLDLANPTLRRLTTDLSPAVWRIGGTPQDEVVYAVGNPPECDSPEKVEKSKSAPGPLCLTMQRWRDILQFAVDCRLRVVFGLNGMYGRRSSEARLNITNAREFIRYTATLALRHAITGFELSNEKLRRVNGIATDVLVRDFGRVKRIIGEAWPAGSQVPLLLGPDSSEKQLKETERFVSLAAGVIDGLTYHSYCAVYSTCDSDMLSLRRLAPCLQSVQRYQPLGARYGIALWAGEVGPHHRGGVEGCSDRFIGAFWYLHQLGSLARLGVRAFARSSLVGGHYGLLDKSSFRPRPDYFAALLWGRLMHTHHLAGVKFVSTGPQETNMFAFASHSRLLLESSTGFTMLLANMDPKQSVEVSLVSAHLPFSLLNRERQEYHISAADPFDSVACIKSLGREWLPLDLTGDGHLPEIEPIHVPPSDRVTVSPVSYVFIVWPGSPTVGPRRHGDSDNASLGRDALVLCVLCPISLLIFMCVKHRWR